MRHIFGILAIAAKTAACNVVPHKGSISAHRLSGQLVDFDTGKPIAGATVCAKYAKLDVCPTSTCSLPTSTARELQAKHREEKNAL